MTTLEALTVLHIVREAGRERRGGYRAYEHAKLQIAEMNLRPDEYEAAIRKVAKVLSI